jgi:hypothetical protein
METNQPDTWTVTTSKRGRPTQDGTPKDFKLAKLTDHWLNPIITSNRFTALQPEEIQDSNPPPGKEDTPKPPPIYITNVTIIPPLLQLLDQITPNLYEVKALAKNQVKVQPKTSESYRLITKALLDRNTQFHTYKLKEERTYRVVLKNMHYSIAPEDIKTEIEKLGHKVANVWNAKHPRTKQPISIFFIDLYPAPNNKDIFNIEFLQQCKIQFEPPRHARDLAQCANCQRYGHTKNFCHLQPRCVKCAGSHPTIQCPRKERSSDVRCVLCEGNHPANYKGCMVYKELQKKTYQPLRQKQYTLPAKLHKTVHEQPGLTYAQIAKQNNSNLTPQAPIPTTNPSQQPSSDTTDLKILLKTLFEQLGTMLNLLSTVLSKLP